MDSENEFTIDDINREIELDSPRRDETCIMCGRDLLDPEQELIIGAGLYDKRLDVHLEIVSPDGARYPVPVSLFSNSKDDTFTGVSVQGSNIERFYRGRAECIHADQDAPVVYYHGSGDIKVEISVGVSLAATARTSQY